MCQGDFRGTRDLVITRFHCIVIFIFQHSDIEDSKMPN